MKAFTDYPFHIDDDPYQIAPIREVEIISYDGDKYCDIMFTDESGNRLYVADVKAGYLYKSPGRGGKAKTFTHEELLPLWKIAGT